MRIKIQQLCNSDRDREVRLEIRNFVRKGTHPVYGSTIVTINQLLQTPNQVFELKNDLGQPAGELNLQRIDLIEKPGFVDFLRSGWNINMSVAIDFTGSNGKIDEPTSLHRQHNKG
jgi:copine 5/8/9